MVRTALFAVILAAGAHAQSTATAPKAPDTPAGKALAGWIASFNAGGEQRKAFLREKTTLQEVEATEIFNTDERFLKEHGPVTLVKILKETPTTIIGVIKHATSGVHGKLTLDVESAAPYRISNMELQGISPDDIKGAN